MSAIEKVVKRAGIHQKANYSGFSHVMHDRIRDGQAMPGNKCIRVYVRKKVPLDQLDDADVIPPTLSHLGVLFEVDIVELYAEALSGINTSKQRPTIPGFSFGHYKITAGTLGAVLYHNGQPFFVTNNHVAANQSSVQNIRARQGDPVLQPGPYDGGKFSATDAGDTVGTLYAFIPLDEVGINKVDVALVAPLDPDFVNPAYGPPVNSPLADFADPYRIGLPFKYLGRTSGYKEVTIVDPSASLSVGYSGFSATFDDVFVFTPGAIGGDSGSGILSADGVPNALAGLVFAGDSANNKGIGCRMSHILEAFSAIGITDLTFKIPPAPPAPPPPGANAVEFVSYSPTKYTNGIPAELVQVKVNSPTVLDFFLLATLKDAAGHTVDITDNSYAGFSSANQPPVATLVFSSIGFGTYTLNMFCITKDGVPISAPVSTPYTYSP